MTGSPAFAACCALDAAAAGCHSFPPNLTFMISETQSGPCLQLYWEESQRLRDCVASSCSAHKYEGQTSLSRAGGRFFCAMFCKARISSVKMIRRGKSHRIDAIIDLVSLSAWEVNLGTRRSRAAAQRDVHPLDSGLRGPSGTPEQVSAAVSQLMCRYAGAVHRYLLKAREGPGRRGGARPGVRGSISPRRLPPQRPAARPIPRLREAGRPEPDQRLLPPQAIDAAPVQAGAHEPAVEDPGLARFETAVPRELADRLAGSCLEPPWRSSRRSTGQPYHTVLRFRVDHPDLTVKPALPRRLSAQLGRPLTAGAVRQALQRSRRKYVDFLLTEVLASLDRPTQDELEEELATSICWITAARS